MRSTPTWSTLTRSTFYEINCYEINFKRGGSDQAKIQSFRSGDTGCRMKEKEKRIQTLFDHFNAGDIFFNKYLGAIKHLTGQFSGSM